VQTRISEGDPEQSPKENSLPNLTCQSSTVIEAMLMTDTGNTGQEFLGKSLRNLKARSTQTKYGKLQLTQGSKIETY
jgi:hypothetical protein